MFLVKSRVGFITGEVIGFARTQAHIHFLVCLGVSGGLETGRGATVSRALVSAVGWVRDGEKRDGDRERA